MWFGVSSKITFQFSPLYWTSNETFTLISFVVLAFSYGNDGRHNLQDRSRKGGHRYKPLIVGMSSMMHVSWWNSTRLWGNIGSRILLLSCHLKQRYKSAASGQSGRHTEQQWRLFLLSIGTKNLLLSFWGIEHLLQYPFAPWQVTFNGSFAHMNIDATRYFCFPLNLFTMRRSFDMSSSGFQYLCMHTF